MFKYVLKRLGLSLIVLLGVSVIIYFLVRLMPTDYLETKFSAQIQQGTLTHDQLDEFKKNYGIYMPEAYLDLQLNGSDFADVTFTKNTKEKKHGNFLNIPEDKTKTEAEKTTAILEYLAGNYENDDGDLKLVIKKDGTWSILKSSGDSVTTEMEGAVTATVDSITFLAGTTRYRSEIGFRLATVGDKFVAVLGGYFTWLGNMLKGELGDSFLYERPVATVIFQHMWISFIISLVALVFQFAIAIPLGIISATRQYSVTDYAVTVTTMIGISLPSFFFAALLIKVFSSWLGWFPTSGLVSGGASAEGLARILDMLHHLVLPMMVLIVLSIGGLMRYTRTNMLEVLNSDYIRTARSKGLSEKKVIYVHAFRNTMIPLMTLLAGILPSLFGGAMITEEVFAIDGIGRLAYKALQQGDVPFIMGYNMFLAVLTVIGTLLSDLMYAVVDPRVKLAK